MESIMDAQTTTRTKRLVALLGDAICHFGRTECECQREVNPADWVQEEEIEKWLEAHWDDGDILITSEQILEQAALMGVPKEVIDEETLEQIRKTLKNAIPEFIRKSINFTLK